MNDEMAWIVQAQNGSDEAYTNLVEAYQTRVYNLCYRMLGEPEAAEDAAQETFLKIYQNLARYDRSRPFATWLLAIAAHHCIDCLRRRRFTIFSIDEDDEAQMELPDRAAPDPETETVRRQEQAHLQQLLQSLNPTDRAALVLRYWQDCSEIEIAQALSLTVPAVKSRLHRARRELAKLWEEEASCAGTERRPHESPAF
ncbi:MAG: sigma-70 family RNA polymerase sigma factor [Anaerolineales bacterium]|nr:sigma-70 family RNA polymerase sigma factor [Anaerolineales bacterium]